MSTSVLLETSWRRSFRTGSDAGLQRAALSGLVRAAADSVFMHMEGMRPPFLVALFSSASFSNCLFKDIYIQQHELFDVSDGGRVRLSDCKFSNVTAGRDVLAINRITLAETTYNDQPDTGRNPSNPEEGEPTEYCDGVWSHDFDEPRFRLLEPTAEDADYLGADGWIQEQTVTDDGLTDDPNNVTSDGTRSPCSPHLNGRLGIDLSPSDPWLTSMRQVRAACVLRAACCAFCMTRTLWVAPVRSSGVAVPVCAARAACCAHGVSRPWPHVMCWHRLESCCAMCAARAVHAVDRPLQARPRKR